ncbi:DUF2804 domain-containing protein [Bradymonadaceae bacterium TMQ3]|uniref:DUF2804 domain-containing protein n=1 Tax=Lujinxingia sediminis TaxID=2480984 RepID=A0ABY0CP81_9DELT|nr:DUF2804 domain-containing protein [Lujinxingia sediminis]RDV36464.1 DUF2804 domain-containing protein [Bradymonadaceae bacterium TMQ3]RVU41423.1 DUF2804 domain-containing protein [Lujinxingia sediminis]TXC74517.1 DUF2804 domain-containing protein [Bradymonadales bacterium TMQ1]
MPEKRPSYPELTSAVDLCRPDGRLNPAAAGFARRPLIRPNLRGGPGWWGRNKRWEYWGIVTPEHVIGVTIASLDYAGLLQLYLYDRRHPHAPPIVQDALLPLARGVVLPDLAATFEAHGRHRDLSLSFAYTPHHAHLRLRSPRVRFELDAPAHGDALGVVIPWSPTRFQYTLKDVARQLRGRLQVDDESFDLRPATSFGVLDRGRGRWPYSMTWNWGAGFGRRGDHTLGLQLGGKWTAHTPGTENALLVDGRLSYIGHELTWEYQRDDPTALWRVHGPRLDATLTPFHLRRADTNALLIASRTRQAFGHWSGWALDAHDQRHDLQGLVGWAEEAANRW